MNFRICNIFTYLSALTVLVLLLSTHGCQRKLSKVKQVEEQFGFEVIVDGDFRSSSRGVTFREVSDSTRISNYLDLLIREYQKYPASYFEQIHLEKIIICDSLVIGTQRRAAYPDPYKKALFLAIDSFEKRVPYMVHVMHHELHHCTEFSLYGSMYFQSEEWNCLNEPNFTYGRGGVSAYEGERKKKNWYRLTHPKEGFVNEYSTLGQEEDRSELMALLMNKTRRDTLVTYCQTDDRLKDKVHYLINEVNGLVETRSNYWEDILKEFPKN